MSLGLFIRINTMGYITKHNACLNFITHKFSLIPLSLWFVYSTVWVVWIISYIMRPGIN